MLAPLLARRKFLIGAACLGAAATTELATPSIAEAAPRRRADDVRSIEMVQARTGERFRGVYFENGRYLHDAMTELDWVLRDVAADESRWTDFRLVDLIAGVQRRLDGRELIITSAYRTRQTNDRLRAKGASKKSLHMKAMAVDFFCPSLSVSRLARIVASFEAGGVGRYDRRGFVHADVGPIRYWRG